MKFAQNDDVVVTGGVIIIETDRIFVSRQRGFTPSILAVRTGQMIGPVKLLTDHVNENGVVCIRKLVHSFGPITDNLRVNYNLNHSSSTNLYAFQDDIAALAGITGVSQNPFDWGLPGLAFTNFTQILSGDAVTE